MSKSIYKSPLLSAKIVRTMVEVPHFLTIVNTYEELYNFKQECIKASAKPVDMHTVEDEENLILNDKLKRDKHIIKQYIEQQIDIAKHSNGNWASLNTLSSEQKAQEQKAKTELAESNNDFKANLAVLNTLQNIENLSIEDRAKIAATTILLEPSIKKYIAGNLKIAGKKAAA